MIDPSAVPELTVRVEVPEGCAPGTELPFVVAVEGREERLSVVSTPASAAAEGPPRCSSSRLSGDSSPPTAPPRSAGPQSAGGEHASSRSGQPPRPLSLIHI